MCVGGDAYGEGVQHRLTTSFYLIDTGKFMAR